MPDFIQEDLSARDSLEVQVGDVPVYVNFATLEDGVEFRRRWSAALAANGHKITRALLSQVTEQDLDAGKDAEDRKRTQSVWWPEAEIGRFAGKAYVNRGALRPGDRVALTPTSPPVPYERANFLPPATTFPAMFPRFPVYIISKGRWETRYTAKALEELGVPYRIVVEPQEADAYRAVINPAKVLVLPFSNLGQGSIPARNWVWEHSIAEGAPWHWIMDDNIQGFYRLHRNLKTPVADGTIFRAAEDFATRYSNVAQFGLHYFMFASRKNALPPYYLNSRVYSCICLRNDLPHRWRGRYNEDTDLSIRILKDGHATVLFSAFLAFKSTTMTMKGGNTEALYAGTETTLATWEEHAKECGPCGSERPWLCAEAKRILEPDGRWRMALSLQEQHPERTTISRKWGRWQHSVDYSDFKQRLIRRPGDVPPAEGVDDYGMVLRVREPGGVDVPGDPHRVVHVHFESDEDIAAFAALTGQRVSRGTDSIWWPEVKLGGKR
jgi:hypothetical protein